MERENKPKETTHKHGRSNPPEPKRTRPPKTQPRDGWRVIRLAATIEMSLVLTQSAFAGTTDMVLPLGGGPLQQIGLCFGAAYVIAEFIELLRPP